MIGDRLFIDLEKHIDLTEFDSLHPEICRGIATARHLAYNGLHTINPGTINPSSQGYPVKPIYEMYTLWESLPDTDPVKVFGKDLDYNELTSYLKFALGGYDLYSLYKVLDVDHHTHGIGEIEQHFPGLVTWIVNFKRKNVFSFIHSATLMTLEAGGIPWEHYDPEVINEKGTPSEFIHIKTDLDRPFYMIDPATHKKTYMNTRVAWWDENDWHGGEPIQRPTYTLRINGGFSKEFKEKIGISNNGLQNTR